jgi:rhodanese-related sulfurtransferase
MSAEESEPRNNSPSDEKREAMPNIREIANKVKYGAYLYLIDVRRSDEYADYRIDGSINLPFDEIGEIEKIVSDKSADIYLFCGTGRLSKSARDILTYMDYENVHDLGGMK